MNNKRTFKEVKVSGIWYCNDKVREFKLNILDKISFNAGSGKVL